jgi:hypothetical protein
MTQLHYHVYVTYQHLLHVSANAAVAIIRLDTICQRSYIDMIQHRTVTTYTNTNNCSVLCHIYIASLTNCIQPDDGHSSIGRNT